MKCEFCNKTFKRESTIISHRCVRKQRWVERDEKYMIMALELWVIFNNVTCSLTNRKLDFKTFIYTKECNAFVALAQHLIALRPISNRDFAVYLFRNNVPAKDWVKDSVYRQFVQTFVRKEQPMKGLERSLKTIYSWAEENEMAKTEFYKNVGPGTFVSMISNGRFSPWMFFLSSHIEDVICRLSQEQMRLINPYINPKLWAVNINKYQSEVKAIRTVIKAENL